MVEAKQISMRYGQTLALDKVSFTAHKGAILGLLGPNGAGKTTIMRILTTFIYPAAGTAIINNYDITQNAFEVKKIIGYMPETVPLYNEMVVSDYLKFIGKSRGLSVEQLKDRLQWVKQHCALKSVWKHLIGELSKGYRQRVGLGQALIHNPDVLILDEPMTGLDPLQIISIRNLIQELKKDKTIIFSSHILSEVEALADNIVILNNGKLIAQGTKQQLLAAEGQKTTLEQAFIHFLSKDAEK